MNALPAKADLQSLSIIAAEGLARSKIYRALEAAKSALGTTSVIVTASYSAAVSADLNAKGYTTVSHDGTNWTISWANAVVVSDDNTIIYPKAASILSMTSQSGEAYICDILCKHLAAAAANGDTNATVTAPHSNVVQSQLESNGMTVSHNGTDWSVSWV